MPVTYASNEALGVTVRFERSSLTEKTTMSMTRKDYVAIAAKLKDLRIPKTDDNLFAQGVNSALNAAAKEMACVFKGHNQSFDRTRFLSACGVQA